MARAGLAAILARLPFRRHAGAVDPVPGIRGIERSPLFAKGLKEGRIGAIQQHLRACIGRSLFTTLAECLQKGPACLHLSACGSVEESRVEGEIFAIEIGFSGPVNSYWISLILLIKALPFQAVL